MAVAAAAAAALLLLQEPAGAVAIQAALLSVPTVVTPSAGGTVSGVDIIVPSGTPGLNALVLGAVDPSSLTGTAFATGAVINRGTTKQVLIFGTGLSSTVEISISGPGDISISGAQSITSRPPDSTPGVAFLATVDPNAALGARTVRLRKGNDLSTFTGGLEVIP